MSLHISTTFNSRTARATSQAAPYIYRRRLRFRDYYSCPQWIEKKKRVLIRDGFTCKLCGHQSPYLEVHHKFYVRGRKPWHYPDHAFMSVCDRHHDFLTTRQRGSRQARRLDRRRRFKRRGRR